MCFRLHKAFQKFLIFKLYDYDFNFLSLKKNYKDPNHTNLFLIFNKIKRLTSYLSLYDFSFLIKCLSGVNLTYFKFYIVTHFSYLFIG